MTGAGDPGATDPSLPPPRRWALRIEYDGGTPFVGWQRQPGATSVQGVLEAAAARLADGRPVAAQAAGRTDSGVHATGQVVLIALPDRPGRAWEPARLQDALNFHLRPHPVVVREAAPAPDDWNPRFSAILRRYRYRILNRRARPTIDRSQVWHVERPLDLDAMRDAAALLVGRHDFSAFRAASCQARSPVRTLDRLDLERDGDEIVVRAAARSFLHHQVRNMVGTLERVGSGRWPPSRVGAALASRDRSEAGPTAPPGGLCLVAVHYERSPFEPSG